MNNLADNKSIFLQNIVLILIVSIGVLFSACGTQKRVVVAKKKEIPSWYKTPPMSTAHTLYAVGIGSNKKDAIADALTQMISTLSVEVSSVYTSKTVAKDGKDESFEGTYTKEMQSVVKPIRISNYELLEAKNLGFKNYAVLIQSNKQKLFKSMLQELKQDFKILSSKESVVVHENALKQLHFYKNALISLKLLPNKLLIMQELDASFDSSAYLKKFNEFNYKYDKLHSRISFTLSANQDALNLKAPIASALSAKKFKIATLRGKNHFRIYIKANIHKANSYGFTLARSSIKVTTKDYKGVVIASNSFDIVGQSSQGYAIAKENVALKLRMMIKKEGIEKLLGLSI